MMIHSGCEYSVRKTGRSYWEWRALNGEGARALPVDSGHTTTSEEDAIAEAQHAINVYLRKKAKQAADRLSRKKRITDMLKALLQKRRTKAPRKKV